MRVACASSEAISQACSNSRGRCCEKTGVRVLPFLKPHDLPFQIHFQRLGQNAAAPRDQSEIALGLLQQRQQQVLQVHLVVAARHAQVGRALGRLAGRYR